MVTRTKYKLRILFLPVHLARIVSVVIITVALSSCKTSGGPETVFLNAEPLGDKWQLPMVTRPLFENDFIAIRNGDYKIQHGDRFEIVVEGQPDTLVLGLPLTPNGYLHYLLCKPFKATDMTLLKLKKALESKLKEFFQDPHVFVNLVMNSSNRFNILGQVTSPGSYNIKLPVKLREAIYSAGGTAKGNYRGEVTDLADLNNSYIIRNNIKLEVDFKKLMYENDPSMNIYLRPNDYIYIAAREFKEVYILGAVTPRAFYHTDDLTMMQLLSSIRYSQNATQSKAVILRKRLTENPETIEIDLDAILSAEAKDIYLQPDDIIYIPEKQYLFVRNLLKDAVRAYVNTFASDASRYISTEHVFNNGQ